MIFTETNLSACFVITPETHDDERGFFARTFDAAEFGRRGLNPVVAECSISYNRQAGTLRGLHYQVAPHEEAKLVRCPRGRVFDVAVDLRPSSPTYLEWYGTILSDDNRVSVYLPEGMAHGFLTLTDHAEVHYQISAAFVPDAARGVRWDDPALEISWPQNPSCISGRDAGWPLIQPIPDRLPKSLR